MSDNPVRLLDQSQRIEDAERTLGRVRARVARLTRECQDTSQARELLRVMLGNLQ
jgi:hypothetical protein